MAKTWKVMRLAEALKGKNFGVFRAEDVSGLRSPVYPDEAPCMLANCTRAEAQLYARKLEAGASVEDIRYERRRILNMMYSGMN